MLKNPPKQSGRQAAHAPRTTFQYFAELTLSIFVTILSVRTQGRSINRQSNQYACNGQINIRGFTLLRSFMHVLVWLIGVYPNLSWWSFARYGMIQRMTTAACCTQPAVVVYFFGRIFAYSPKHYEWTFRETLARSAQEGDSGAQL